MPLPGQEWFVEVGGNLGDERRTAVCVVARDTVPWLAWLKRPPHTKHQLYRRGRAFVTPALEQEGIAPPMRGTKDPAVRMQRHLKEDHVDLRPGPPADFRVFGKVVKVHQGAASSK